MRGRSRSPSFSKLILDRSLAHTHTHPKKKSHVSPQLSAAEADEVDEHILVEILRHRNFFHALCSAEEYPLDVQGASDAMLLEW